MAQTTQIRELTATVAGCELRATAGGEGNDSEGQFRGDLHDCRIADWVCAGNVGVWSII